MKKQVSYTSVNTYETMNKLDENVKNIWFVFHGIGFLSRFFLKYFSGLNSDENYIVAPQAPSKYYLNNEYKNVGASWLTKEETALEINNLLNYLDEVYRAEHSPSRDKLIVFGFSQGVSIAARWVANRKIPCKKLIFYAGGLPNELSAIDFDFLGEETEIVMIYGDKDPYLIPERLEGEKEKLRSLFGGRARTVVFNGGHELLSDEIQKVLTN